MPPTTAYRRVGSDAKCMCSGMSSTFAFSIPSPGCCCGNMYARNAAGIALRKKTIPSTCRFRFPSYCGEPDVQGLTSAHSATLFITSSENRGFAASSASSPWPRSSAPPRSKRRARWLWKWACMNSASFVAISNVPPNLPCGKSTRSFANWFTTAISSTSKPRSQKMNLIELNRALGQLRLGGIAAVLETRLRQAQAEAMPPIDFLSCLVSDELTRRGDRLLERRKKQAAFRDPHKTLDNFDFNFNRKMNRSLVFDLATGAFIARHEDGLFLGPPGTGKSHLAQAIGQAVIGQGYRVIYREAHILLEEIAEAALDGKRKEHMELLATVPLLIIDDLGMRKLPMTAAEDLLEIVMRRYERTSTLLTSNRPVDDWGKLLGDSAAVTAMLDRLLHHGHVLKCGPRSWRTKTDLPPHEAAE